MTNYKLIIEDRTYEKFQIVHAISFKEQDIILNPLEHKMFHNDMFQYNNNKVEIIHSVVKLSESLAAVLILNNNKTYGKHKDKLLYKCIPDDNRIPPFLVPYDNKNIGFSKLFSNLYITIRFTEWNGKHPQAQIVQIIGPVDNLENFYEYQLYCKTLNNSINKFNKDTNNVLKKKTKDCNNEQIIKEIWQHYPELEDRTDSNEWSIFSIDPVNSVDFDDAFSIKSNKNTSNQDVNEILVSIYISNVAIWMDFLNLWESFSKRIATIYLPDKKRPMLPFILSDCLCSLQENKLRIAFVLDIIIHKDTNEILTMNYTNAIIKVKKNYIYEENELIKDNNYQELFNLVKQLGKKNKYINKMEDSHDLVSYLMILMNVYCAKDLIKYNNGIFRSTSILHPVNIPDNLPDDISKFLHVWNSFSGHYIDLSKNEHSSQTRHHILEMDAYVHITSPIRRLVDLLNLIQFQKNHSLITFSEKAYLFYEKWLNEMEYINISMRSIRKIQNDCQLLSLCIHEPSKLEKEYEGYCIDKIVRNDGLFQFIVYLPEIKLTSRIIVREDIPNFEKRFFTLYLFNNEEKFKKKIRIQLV
jgi:exoribonuclease R